MILFLDTETNKYWLDRAEVSDEAQAIAVQVAALLEDDRGQLISGGSTLLSRSGWARRRMIEIEERCVEKHGISEGMLDRLGEPPQLMANRFRWMLERATLVVGHNIPFDVQIMDATFAALALPPLSWPPTFCTMRESTDIVRKPSSRSGHQYGWPKLGEAFYHFVRRPLPGAHNALYDIIGTQQVYRGILRHRAAEVSEPFVSSNEAQKESGEGHQTVYPHLERANTTLEAKGPK